MTSLRLTMLLLGSLSEFINVEPRASVTMYVMTSNSRS